MMKQAKLKYFTKKINERTAWEKKKTRGQRHVQSKMRLFEECQFVPSNKVKKVRNELITTADEKEQHDILTRIIRKDIDFEIIRKVEKDTQ